MTIYYIFSCSIECPVGKAIQINSANYGRTAGKNAEPQICPSRNVRVRITCFIHCNSIHKDVNFWLKFRMINMNVRLKHQWKKSARDALTKKLAKCLSTMEYLEIHVQEFASTLKCLINVLIKLTVWLLARDRKWGRYSMSVEIWSQIN